MAIYKLQAVSGKTETKAPSATIVEGQDEQVILDLMAACLEQTQFIAVAHTLVNELAQTLQCDRVSLGLKTGKEVLIHALSLSSQFEKQSVLTRLITNAMQETLDQKLMLVFPATGEQTQNILYAHEQLAKAQAGKSICTVPLVHANKLVGALTLERPADRPFDQQTLHLIQRMALLLGPVLTLKYEEEHWLHERVWQSTKSTWSQLTGRGQYTKKLSAILAIIFVVFMAFAQGDYRISGDAVLEGKIERLITSPIDGYIATVKVRAGDTVKKGQSLANLDDRELKLEKLRLEGEYEKHKREYRDARAKYDLTQVGIVGARMQQAKAQLDVTNEQLKRLHITSPFDGIVVEGNIDDALGAPVERGQMLLKLAPLNDYRIILKVDDRDIARIAIGQTGRLALAGLPGEPLDIVVNNITPVSIAENGRNYFKVEAQLKHRNQFLRPGMQGVGKVDVGEHSLLWIWTHRFTDWVRYWLWSL